jgi:hypothetical protein
MGYVVTTTPHIAERGAGRGRRGNGTTVPDGTQEAAGTARRYGAIESRE